MSMTFRHRIPIRLSNRSFSTSTARPISLQIDRNDPEAVADTVPAYPYGPARWYKQSDKGLYGGQRIRFGNNVGPKFQTKTRRSFKPNIQNKRLWSIALNRFVQVRVSTRVLRTVDKVGGLDEYLLGEKESRIRELGMSGWWLRWAIMQTRGIQTRFRKEREGLGISELRTELKALADNKKIAAVEHAALAEAAVEAEDQIADQSEASALRDEEALQVLEDTNVEEGNEIDLEPIAMDGAFRVEVTPELPLLRFRVARGQHIILTPDGWRRTRRRPNEKKIEQEKEEMKSELFDGFVERRMDHLTKRLDALQRRAEGEDDGPSDSGQTHRRSWLNTKKSGPLKIPTISPVERAVILSRARAAVKQRLKKKVDDHYSHVAAFKEERSQEKRAARVEAKKLEKVKRASELTES